MKKVLMVLAKAAISLLWLNSTAALANTHRPQAFVAAIQGKKDEGAQIVQHFCSNCHAEKPLIALGAPRFQNEEDWVPRLKAGTKRLLQHTFEGIGAMPARGGCFECSDTQLILAIAALLPTSLQKPFLLGLKEYKKST